MKKFLISLLIIGFGLVVICGIGLYAQGEKLAKDNKHNDKVNTNLSKIYKQDISALDINSNMSDISIKKGSHFSIQSRGNDKNIKVKSYIKDKKWIIKEQSKESIINFRYQNNVENHIIVTVPEKLNKINIRTVDGDLDVNNIKAKEAQFSSNSSDINMNKGDYNKLIVNNDSGDITTSEVKARNIKLSNNSGDIVMKNMRPDVDSNIKNDSGDISLYYKEKPKNTLLDIHNDSGDSYIKNQKLKDKKVGNGDNKLQLFNNSGDIEVK